MKKIIVYLWPLLTEDRYIYYKDGLYNHSNFEYIRRFISIEGDLDWQSAKRIDGYSALSGYWWWDTRYDIGITMPFIFIRKRYVYLDYIYFDKRIDNRSIIFIEKRLINIGELINKEVIEEEYGDFQFDLRYFINHLSLPNSYNTR